MDHLVGILRQINWISLVTGAFVGALSLALRMVIQAPIKALVERSFAIKWFSFLSPQRPFQGKWKITWRVTSRRFPEENSDKVNIYRLFSSVTFTTIAVLRDGSQERCVFVGKILDRTITGRWFNPADEERGYFGIYQVRLHASLQNAAGSWVGWTNDGQIQSNQLLIEKAR